MTTKSKSSSSERSSKKKTTKRRSSKEASDAKGGETATSTKKKTTKRRAKKEPRGSILDQLPPPRQESDDAETLAFLQAVDAFKRKSGRSFPSYTELLQIVKSLGYRKVANADR